MWIMLNTYFPSGSLMSWYVLSRKCLCDQSTIKTLVAESLNRFPWQKHCTRAAVFLLQGDALCDCSWERESRWKAA